MKLAAFTFIVVSLSAVAAQQKAGFDVPTAYSVDRYEAGWNTNPFTLKTAPAAVEKISSFKDLTLGNMYQYGGDSRVTLINVKTRERIRLSSTKADPSGMRIKSATIVARRSDSYAEIEKDGETAVLRYDDKLLATLSNPGQIAQHAGPDAGNPNMADMAAGGGPGGIPSTLPGATPPRGRMLNGGPPPPSSTMPNNGTVNGLPNTGAMPLPNRNAPPQRRRLLTAPQQQPRPSSPPPPGMQAPVLPP